MKSKLKLVVALVAVAVLLGAAGAAGAWFGQRPRADGPQASASASSAPAAVAYDSHPQKYVTLEKVIVMLRHEAGDSVTHYLAVDIVFRTPEDGERTTRDHLPMLRSVAVKTLAALPVAQASAMTIDDYATEINRAFTDSYARERREKPFSEAMIGKLIIE